MDDLRCLANAGSHFFPCPWQQFYPERGNCELVIQNAAGRCSEIGVEILSQIKWQDEREWPQVASGEAEIGH